MTNKFDAAYKGFDTSRPFGLSWEQYCWHRHSQFLAAAESLVPGRVLDNGGAFGHFSSYVPRHWYTNSDVSEVMLSADKGDHPRIRVDGKSLPFRNDCFDNVVSLGVLRHVDDPDAYLSECRRVLRPGGIFVLATVRKGYERDLAFSWLFWAIGLYYLQWVIPQRLKGMFRRLSGDDVSPTSRERIAYVSYDERDLENRLTALGFGIFRRGRFCKDLPGPVSWRFADKIVNEARFGKFTFFACRKT